MLGLDFFITNFIPTIILSLISFAGIVNIIAIIHQEKMMNDVNEMEDLIDLINYKKSIKVKINKKKYATSNEVMNFLFPKKENLCLSIGLKNQIK